MQLKAYLTQHGLTAAEFARVAGFRSRQLVHAYAAGQRFPTPENMLRIREATAGTVTADDFVDQHTGGPAPAAEAAA